MAPLHHAPKQPIEPMTKMVAPRSGRYLPLIGTMLATAGFLLLIAGLQEMPSSSAPARRGWLPTQAVDDKATMTSRPVPLGRAWAYSSVTSWTSVESGRFGYRWVLPRASRVTPQSAKSRLHDALQPASSSQALRHDSDVRIARAFFRDDLDPSAPGIVRSNLQQEIRDPRSCPRTNANSADEAALPLCQDPRDDLATMAAAQRRGSDTRWDGTAAFVAAWDGSDDHGV